MKKVKELTQKLTALIGNNFDMRDAFVFGGIALMAGGLWFVHKPAAAIVPGILFFWLGVRKVN